VVFAVLSSPAPEAPLTRPAGASRRRARAAAQLTTPVHPRGQRQLGGSVAQRRLTAGDHVGLGIRELSGQGDITKVAELLQRHVPDIRAPPQPRRQWITPLASHPHRPVREVPVLDQPFVELPSAETTNTTAPPATSAPRRGTPAPRPGSPGTPATDPLPLRRSPDHSGAAGPAIGPQATETLDFPLRQRRKTEI
jgi:hypothetical protein